MRARLPFLFVALFFVTMNVLLWRSEFGGHEQFGAKVPSSLVWEKLLTAPDNSFLAIQHHGKKVGTLHWSPTIGALRSQRLMNDEIPPEGMVEELTSYDIELNGNINLDEATKLRFSVDLRLDTNQVWQEMTLRISLRPAIWELHTVASQKTLRLKIDDGQERSQRVISFDDLRDPNKLIKEFGGPLLPPLLASLGLPGSATRLNDNPNTSLGLIWRARYDRLHLGGDWMRVFRLETRLFDRFEAVFFVSPVGEVLRVELPDQIVLVNDALASFPPGE